MKLRMLKKISDKKLKSIDKYLVVSGQNFINILCSNYILPEWFLHKYKNSISWDLVCQYQILTDSFIRNHISNIKDYDSWLNLSRYQVLSLDFLEEHENDIEWEDYSFYNEMNKEIVSKFYSKFNLIYIKQRNIIENFITEEELDALEIMQQITK